MHYRFILYPIVLALFFLSCKKDQKSPDPDIIPPSVPAQKILLKDIVIPHLPSPYYHFEYGADSLVTKADFASGYFIYDVLYNNGRIREMRNNILVNHDTLRYVYDAGKVAKVIFIDQNNVLKRHVSFAYSDQQVTQITWDHKTESDEFVTDRMLSFTYHADGNLKEMNDYRPSAPGIPEVNFTLHYDDYDDKINVDDFTLIHDGIHDHFLILPALHLQKNNARKEWMTGVENEYTVNYIFSYNNDNTPKQKSGELVFTSGSQSGQKFNVGTNFSYY